MIKEIQLDPGLIGANPHVQLTVSLGISLYNLLTQHSWLMLFNCVFAWLIFHPYMTPVSSAVSRGSYVDLGMPVMTATRRSQWPSLA